MKSVIGLSSLLPVLVAASPVVSVGSIHNDAAPLISSVESQVIPDSYMVVFKDHVTESSAADHHLWVQDVHASREFQRDELRKRSSSSFASEIYKGLKHTYSITDAFLGYSGHFDESTIEEIRRHPDVAFVEKDSIVHTMDDGELEKGAPWGLARVSHRDHLSFGTFNKYLYAKEGGEGVDVYVIDTGTNIEHVDFEGRAKWGKTIPDGDEDEDGNGHGTHCSGTVAGKKYGVAKKAHVYAVKVLRSNGSGSMSDVVRGVEWAAQAHEKAVKEAKSGKRKGFKGSTANMSLGGGKSNVLDLAVNAAVDAGIHFAVAAGNDNADSCKYSPAAAEKAITVGASTIADERAYFSNYGTCNDIFAPGLNILSTWKGSKYALNTISGTSMASPHIAGLLAYLLSLQPAKDSAYAVADITPKKLKADLLSIATYGALTDVPSNTANILAWNGGGSTNYTKIVKDGGYTVEGARSSVVHLAGMVESAVKDEFNAGKDVVDETVSKVHKHASEISVDLEDFVHDMTDKFESFLEKEIDRLEASIA